MKNLLPLLLFFSFAVQAQTTSQGTIYYSKYPNIFSGSSISKNNEVFAPESENAAFILYFNTDQSFYSYDVASNNKRESQRAMVAMSRGGYYQRNFSEELFYKNLAQQQYVRKTSLYGRYFIIEDKMSSLAWEIGTETKIIAGHLCIKAIIPDTTTFISTNTFIDVNGVATVEKTRKKTGNTVAWFAPDLPVSSGPGEYHGLPGMILRLDKNGDTLVATRLELAPVNNSVFKKPTGRRKVNEATFRRIEQQKIKENIEMQQSNSRREQATNNQ